MDESRVHFGWFLAQAWVARGFKSARAFCSSAKITPKTLERLVKMPEPSSYPGTLGGLARAMGYKTPDDFDAAWRSTKVRQPKARPPAAMVTIRVPRPLYESWKRAAAADGITPIQWLAKQFEVTVNRPIPPVAPESSSAEHPPAVDPPRHRQARKAVNPA